MLGNDGEKRGAPAMKTIGKYEICGLLGRGGMSRVYKVQLPVVGKIAALKLLYPNPFLEQLLGNEKLQKLFVSEAITMANLRHPNIVEIWDFDEMESAPFYTMDYYSNNLGTMIGETYMTEKTSRVIELDKAIHYIRQTLQGLACLHHAGIIHRDIKPYNIMITEQDTVKISDFGLSKLRGEAFGAPPNLKVGSPWYAAPEQEDNPDKVDPRADLYAVGVMLYRMLTGKLPAQGTPADRIDTPSRFNSDLDEIWDKFILRAIAPKVNDRFGSAKEMLDGLNALHLAWEEKKEKICSLPATLFEFPSRAITEKVRLRSRSIKVNSRQAGKIFVTDQLWRPQKYIQNDFRKNRAGTIADRTTGLIWQQSGSEYPFTWDRARVYIEQLNNSNVAGHNNWRLPTINELLSLLKEPRHRENFCLEPLFDKEQKWLWSADRRSYTTAWYVNAEMGFVAWQDTSGLFYARGVCEIRRK
jgi:serine/threonine-protein kinase